jgi:hypothetical protein
VAAKWLVERWETFFPALQQAKTEEEVKALCDAEVDAWRAQPGIKKESSLRNHMDASKKEIETRLTGQQQAWTRKYLLFSREWYITHNASSKDTTSYRLTHQQFITDPDEIVAVATELLKSPHWYEIVVGLAVCTGRRLIECLVAGKFEYKTEYSIWFSGAVKRQVTALPPFEIPTLCTAQAVIDAVARLRELLPLDQEDIHGLSRKYSPAVKDAANIHFKHLVPVRPAPPTKQGEARKREPSLYAQLFRTVYARIAVYWYALPDTADTHYMSSITGHFEYDDLETEELRQSYNSNANYSDYKIADRQGNIDGRQGLKLGMKGVELLDIYKPPTRKERTAMTDTTITQEQEPKTEGRNVPISVDRETFNREQALKLAKKHRTHTQTITLLLDTYYQQTGESAAAPYSIVDGIRSILAGSKDYQEFKQAEKTTDAAKLLDEVLAGDEQSFYSLLVSALMTEAKFRQGLGQRYAGKDFASMTLKELLGTRHIGASNERIIRSLYWIALYNDDPARAKTERWFINTTSVQKLASGRYETVTKFLTSHKAQIDALNGKYELNDKYNNKPYPITDVITVPDEPPAREELVKVLGEGFAQE